VATLPGHNSEIQSIFQILDSRFAELLRAGDTIQFGIHYSRQVEFEYEVGMASSRDADLVQRSVGGSATGMKGSSLLPVADLMRVDGGVRGVLKVPKDRYEAWLAEVKESTKLHAAAGSRRD
jgi:hypothetical protein